jgi:hypothetical protein
MKNHRSIATLIALISSFTAGHASAGLSAEDFPDLYGSILFDAPPTKQVDVAANPGYGDNYGSILLDPPPARSADVAAKPGYGDSYGSILLDIANKRSPRTVAKGAGSY